MSLNLKNLLFISSLCTWDFKSFASPWTSAVVSVQFHLSHLTPTRNEPSLELKEAAKTYEETEPVHQQLIFFEIDSPMFVSVIKNMQNVRCVAKAKKKNSFLFVQTYNLTLLFSEARRVLIFKKRIHKLCTCDPVIKLNIQTETIRPNSLRSLGGVPCISLFIHIIFLPCYVLMTAQCTL